MKQKKRVTVQVIADLAGVSPTTVSHVFNERADRPVAAASRRRILEVAEAVGYQKSMLNRAIKEPLKHMGLAVGGHQSHSGNYRQAIFDGLRDEAEQLGYYPIIQPLPTRPGQTDCSEALAKMVEMHESRLVDGFVIDKSIFTTRSIRDFMRKRIPCVLINGAIGWTPGDGSELPAVAINDHLGMGLAVRHLHDLGHADIALLMPPYQAYPIHYRPYRVMRQLAGFREAMVSRGLDAGDHRLAEFDPDDKRQIAAALGALFVGARRSPTAVIACDDDLALMALNGLRVMGRGVPADVSLVSYGDWQTITRLAEPELTVVHVPFAESGRAAARMLVELIRRGPQAAMTQILDPEMIPRRSTAPRT